MSDAFVCSLFDFRCFHDRVAQKDELRERGYGWVGRYGKCLDIPFGRHLSHGQTLAIKVLLFYFLGPEHNSQLSGTMPPPASVDLDAFPMFFFFWWPLPNKMSVEERRGGPGWLMDIFAECRSTSNAPNCGFWRDANEF